MDSNSLVAGVAFSVDLLAIEVSWAQKTANFSLDLAVVGAFENALKGDLCRVVSATKSFVNLNGLLPFSLAFKSFSSEFNAIPLQQPSPSDVDGMLRMLSGPSFLADDGTFIACNGRNTVAAIQWFMSLSIDGTSGRVPSVKLFSELEIECNHLSNELRLLLSWKSFAQMLHVLLKKWRRDAPESALFRMSSGNFLRSMTMETLRSFRNNVELAERCHMGAPSSILTREVLSMGRAMSGLLLTHQCAEDLSHVTSPDEWIESMGLIAEIARKLSRYSLVESTEGRVHSIGTVVGASVAFISCPELSSQQNDFKTMAQLLASAADLANSSLGKDSTSSAEFGAKSRIENIYLDFASTSCQVLRTLEHATLKPIDFTSSFCTCVAVLSSVIEKTGASSATWEIDYHYTERLCQVFKEFDLIRSLVSQAGSHSSANADDIPVLSALGLFTKMAASGDPNMLSLLVNNESALFLSSRQVVKPSPGDALPQPMYSTFRVSDTSPVASTSQPDDPRHIVWCASMNLVGACLRSSTRNAGADGETAARFYMIAADFIRENKDAVLRCLKQCSSVEFGPNASKQHAFTLNILREAKLVLAIISELCKKTAFNVFKRSCPELLSVLISQAASLFVSLSTFLGASGSSRDIFHALNEVESVDAMNDDQGSQFAALGPVYRLLAGGLQDAKHEAIRFSSHFVLNCTRAITQVDDEARRTFSDRRKTDALERAREGSLSMSSLEHECRSGVTSKFAFQMEVEAADCLFFAMQILWKTHPASSSFVMYSEAEVRQLDAMSFVRPGTVIAFRNNDQRLMFLPFDDRTDINQTLGGERLQFARVLHCNTVNRQWRVQLVSHGSSQENCLVDESQLAGIEDTSRRIAMLSYAGAPELSSDLEAMRGPVSVGHLILALRWCSQFYTEKRDDLLPHETGSAIARLAELSSAFVGLELSVHQETRSRLRSAADLNSKILADQLLDLFGDATEFACAVASFHGSALSPREGRLKPILSPESWYGTRSQLRSYLDTAVVDMSSKVGVQTRPIEAGGSVFLRRSGSTSPFRGLGI